MRGAGTRPTHHSLKSCGSERVRATMRAPCEGGLDHVMRTIFSIWDSTRRMLSDSLATTVRFPTRSSREEGVLSCGGPTDGEHWVGARRALTVEPEVLGERLGTEELESFRHKIANSPGIFLQVSGCEALIG